MGHGHLNRGRSVVESTTPGTSIGRSAWEGPSESATARIWRSDTHGSSWTQQGDPYYQGSAYTPMTVVIGTDGRAYVAVANGAVIIGAPG